MENKNKWNKELLYSAIFLFAGIIVFLFHPSSSTMIDFLMLLPLYIKDILFNIGALPIILTASWLVLCLFFFLCSVYLGVLSIVKAQPIASLLAYLLILLSAVAFIGLIVALLFFTTL